MILPTLNTLTANKISLNPKGVDISGTEKSFDYLYDSVNLEYKKGCSSLSSRKLALAIDFNADQIITLKDRAFVRNSNQIREILSDENGMFSLSSAITLSDINPSPNRQIIEVGEKLFIFPDQIALNGNEDVWQTFGLGYSVADKMPFVKADCMYYNENFLEGTVCSDITYLSVGDKLRFSWCPNEEFFIIKIEDADGTTEYGNIIDGKYVWLDRNVPNYNSIPDSSQMYYCNPFKTPLVNPFYFGMGELIYRFMGNTLHLANSTDSLQKKDSPEKYFYIGQKVAISNALNSQNNKIAVITGITDVSITFNTSFISENSLGENVISITPVLPNADLLLYEDERLWIVDNSEKILWASMEGNPTAFYSSNGESSGSWRCNLTRIGTALIYFKNQILCFHESGCTKIYGSNASNFFKSNLIIRGIPQKSNTAQIIGDTLFYLSQNGMNRLDSVYSKEILSGFTSCKDISTTAEGECYYILKDNRVWVYSAEKDKWYSEDGEGVLKLFSCMGKRCYLKQDGIYTPDDASETGVNWSLITKGVSSDNFVSPLNLKVKLFSQEETQIFVGIDIDDKGIETPESFSVQGKERITLSLPKEKCGEFKIKLWGEGKINIEEISIYYRRI